MDAGENTLRCIRLINPNSNPEATHAMAESARSVAPPDVCIEATTSHAAAPLITTADQLAAAEAQLLTLFDAGLEPLDGVIVAAFGDPAVGRLRARMAVPVTGLAEAAMLEASDRGPFAVCTTTPDLEALLRGRAQALGLADTLIAVCSTSADPLALMRDEELLDAALAELVHTSVRTHRVASVIIGGGPLASAARRLAASSPVPIIQPVPAAVRRICTMWSPGGGH